MVARLSPSKCQPELFEAVLPLLQADDSLHFVLAGREYPAGNGMIDHLRGRAAEARVSSQVHLMGHRSDVPAVLDGLDVFAHPSRLEPCALSILEAMSHGLPVVAWREGGTVELVSHLETGILVPPMEIPALTQAIKALLTDGKRRKEMGDAGRARVRSRFRADEAAQRFVKLLARAASPLPENGQPITA
jgi:glycosyltransferase involved in cell wall biosynthesis